MKEIILITTLALTLNACTTLDSIGAGFTSKPYVDIQSGERAKIRVLETGGESIRFYPNSTCKTSNDKDRGIARTKSLPSSFTDKMLSKATRYEPKSLGMPFPPATDKGQQYFEFYVPANREFLITSYWNFNGQLSCPSTDRIVNFSPNKNYEFFFNLAPNGACGYELKEINDQGDRIAFNNQKIVSEEDTICKVK